MRRYETIRPLPGGVPFIGNVLEVLRDPLGFFERAHAEDDIVRGSFMGKRAISAIDPDLLQHVLQQSPKRYTKSPTYDALKPLVGLGLLTSEGDFWRRQRRLMQPAFHLAKLRSLTRTMVEVGSDMLAEWSRWEEGRVFDLNHEMMRITLRIAGLTLMDADLGGDARDVGGAVEVGLEWARSAAINPLHAPRWIPTRYNRSFERALRTLDHVVQRVVSARRVVRSRRQSGLAQSEHQESRADLLDLMMTPDAHGESMSDVQLRDEVMTLLLAGHETTANSLSWTGMLLAQNPIWAERVANEAHEVLGDRTPTFEDLSKLEIAERVLSESLRLYPPAWVIERQASEDDIAADLEVPKGTMVLIPSYVLQRSSRHWERPLEFDPDRFLPSSIAARSRYTYLPFGDGPRVCIGKAFAMMEGKLLLAMMARHLRFELDSTQTVVAEPVITLRPKDGIRMRYRRRSFDRPIDQSMAGAANS